MKRSLQWLGALVLLLAFYMLGNLGMEKLLPTAAPAPGQGASAPGGQSAAGSSAASSASAAGSSGAASASSADAAAAAKAAQAQAQLDDWRMILVSPASPMPDGYTVETKACNNDTTNNTLQAEAAEAFLQMKAAAAADGVTLHLQSGYRSVEYQSGLFDRQIQKWKDAGMSEADAIAKAKTIVTPPGCSEHNCGLAADINSPEYTALEEAFKNTNAYAWLCAHAEEYGFILRYPQDKEDITGIIYEPWHWRYVGVENARLINESGLCLEEYIEQLRLDAAV